jgi:hypothetical protein
MAFQCFYDYGGRGLSSDGRHDIAHYIACKLPQPTVTVIDANINIFSPIPLGDGVIRASLANSIRTAPPSAPTYAGLQDLTPVS